MFIIQCVSAVNADRYAADNSRIQIGFSRKFRANTAVIADTFTAEYVKMPGASSSAGEIEFCVNKLVIL